MLRPIPAAAGTGAQHAALSSASPASASSEDAAPRKRKLAAEATPTAAAAEDEWIDDPYADSTSAGAAAAAASSSPAQVSLLSPAPIRSSRGAHSAISSLGNIRVAAAKQSPTTLHAMLAPAAKRAKHSPAAAPKSKAAAKSSASAASFFSRHSPPPTASAAFSSAAASSVAASSAAAAASPCPLVREQHQVRVDDLLDREYRSLNPLERQVRQRQAERNADTVCAKCNEMFLGKTKEDHARECKPPAPVTCTSTALNKCVNARCDQAATLRSVRSGGVLHCAKPGQFDAAIVKQALVWLHSMLNSSGGGNLDDHEARMEDEEKALQLGQELWLYHFPRAGNFELACAVLVRSSLADVVVRANTEAVQLTPARGGKQQSLTAFMPTIASSSVPALHSIAGATCSTSAVSTSVAASSASAAPSSAAAAPQLLPPLFGVDKVALHASYRFGATMTAAASASASAGAPSVSLAHHVLLSILDAKSTAQQHASDAPSDRRRIAFSSTTKEGAKLAARVTGMREFATYTMR